MNYGTLAVCAECVAGQSCGPEELKFIFNFVSCSIALDEIMAKSIFAGAEMEIEGKLE